MDTTASPTSLVDLTVRLGHLQLANPIMVASGTFGYAREMERMVALDRLGAVIPKTITYRPRIGNVPWRTVETPCGLLNSIGLDNDGLDAFLKGQLPYLVGLACPTVVSIAASSVAEFSDMAATFGDARGSGRFGAEYLLSQCLGGRGLWYEPHGLSSGCGRGS